MNENENMVTVVEETEEVTVVSSPSKKGAVALLGLAGGVGVAVGVGATKLTEWGIKKWNEHKAKKAEAKASEECSEKESESKTRAKESAKEKEKK